MLLETCQPCRSPRGRGEEPDPFSTSRDAILGSVTNEPGYDGGAGVTRRTAGSAESSRASRSWWDASADDYLEEHGAFLGDARFVWGPEGLSEAGAGLLGDVSGRRVLEIGCGAAQCSRWLLAAGAEPVGLDLSAAMLGRGRQIGAATALVVPLVQADATHLPFASSAFDVACSAYGALPFVADSSRVMREVARVLRPGGRWVFSVTHPVRWSFADNSGPAGLVARDSYWDRTPYVEEGPRGQASYVEHHRTMGDRVREIVAAGLRIWSTWSSPSGRLT